MQAITRILISRMKFIGDIVLTTPIIHTLRQQYPTAYIAYLGDKDAVSLLENNPHLNEIIPYNFTQPSFFEQLRVIRLLRKQKFDIFIDLFSNPRTAVLARASGALLRIGKSVKGRGKLYTHQIDDDGKPKTAVEFHYQYVKPIGVEPMCWRTEMFLTDDEKHAAKKFLISNGINPEKPIVGLHPGATWPAKMWHAEYFTELANLVINSLKVQVIITRGPNEKSLIDAISQNISSNIKVLDVLPLRRLASVLSQLKVYVANDSGPMHIAVAVGTKTIGIFGPGEENIWFPYTPPYYDASAGHIALRKDVSCHPCHLDFCNREGANFMECMKLLTVEEVLAEVKKRL